MNMSVFYFSGTGNTRWAVDTLCEALTKNGVDAKSTSIEAITTRDTEQRVASVDAVGLAWPIYGSDIPENMKDFIRSLPAVKSKPLLTLCTQYLFSGDGAYVMHQILKQKGYVYHWSTQLNMPNNLSIYPLFFKRMNDYAYHERKRLIQACNKLKSLAQRIAKGQKHVKGATPFHTLAAMLQRPLYRLGLRNGLKNWLSTDPNRCNGCSLCVKNCPAKNIELIDGVAHIHDQCLICMRCYDFCPQTAIMGKGHHHNMKFGPPYKGPTKAIYDTIMHDHRA